MKLILKKDIKSTLQKAVPGQPIIVEGNHVFIGQDVYFFSVNGSELDVPNLEYYFENN